MVETQVFPFKLLLSVIKSELTSNYEFGEKFSMKDNKLQNIPKIHLPENLFIIIDHPFWRLPKLFFYYSIWNRIRKRKKNWKLLGEKRLFRSL